MYGGCRDGADDDPDAGLQLAVTAGRPPACDSEQKPQRRHVLLTRQVITKKITKYSYSLPLFSFKLMIKYVNNYNNFFSNGI